MCEYRYKKQSYSIEVSGNQFNAFYCNIALQAKDFIPEEASQPHPTEELVVPPVMIIHSHL